MFDANMKGLPLRSRAFAKIGQLPKDHPLTTLCCDDYEGVLKFTMMSESYDNPTVRFENIIDGKLKFVYLSDSQNFFETWIKYIGCVSGSGFINAKDKEISQKIGFEKGIYRDEYSYP